MAAAGDGVGPVQELMPEATEAIVVRCALAGGGVCRLMHPARSHEKMQTLPNSAFIGKRTLKRAAEFQKLRGSERGLVEGREHFHVAVSHEGQRVWRCHGRQCIIADIILLLPWHPRRSLTSTSTL